MKVQGPSSSTAAASRGTRSVAAPGFSLPTPEVVGAQNSRGASATANIANLGALLAAQAIPDEGEKRRRATRRANSLLDSLDDVRLATLNGTVSKSHLATLSQSLREQSDKIDDIGLQEILEEIELRAEVELAKLEMAL